MRVDWFGCVCGDSGDGETHYFFLFLACVLVLSWRALAALLPCRNSAGARSARCSLSVVSCAIVSHVVSRFYVSRVFSEHGAPFLWYDRG